MFKKRNLILFSLPLLLLLIVIGALLLLFWQNNRFRQTYISEVQADTEIRARLLARLISPELEGGNPQAIQILQQTLPDDNTRITLIDKQGTVLYDSHRALKLLDNHADRQEISQALNGSPASSYRYSTSLNSWMFYYALPLPTSDGDNLSYVLRVSFSNQRLSRILQLSRGNILAAAFLGSALVLLLLIYTVYHVFRPLERLRETAGRLADGDLKVKIEIPRRGMVRELAIILRRVAEELKRELQQVTAERNERDAIFNAMSEAVLLLNDSNEVIRRNQAAEKLFSIVPGQLQFNLARCGSSALLQFCKKAFNTGQSEVKELTFQRHEQEVTLLIKGGILSHEGGRYLLLVIADLTGLHRLESFRSDFIANVSHEIKTPLTSIISAVENLEDNAMQEPDIAKKLLRILGEQARRLHYLVQDILNLAALERQEQKGQQNFNCVRLDHVLENARQLCIDDAKQAGITLKISLMPNLEIAGDCQLLEQALTNLINNAIKYSNSPEIELELRQQNKMAAISVRDFGVGIAQEHQERIFERFYRIHKERSQILSGTGLGLAIVKHIAQLHHGSIQLQSQPGRGCIFTILLPLAKLPPLNSKKQAL